MNAVLKNKNFGGIRTRAAGSKIQCSSPEPKSLLPDAVVSISYASISKVGVIGRKNNDNKNTAQSKHRLGTVIYNLLGAKIGFARTKTFSLGSELNATMTSYFPTRSASLLPSTDTLLK